MWTATRILERLGKQRRIGPHQSMVTRCAALLHDIGHGPLSHVFESFLGIHHEEWTLRIIRDPSSGVNRVLRRVSPGFAAQVAGVIGGRSNPPFLSHIIASQFDADRLDYLLRDSLMTGVKHGVYDLERILHILRIDAAGRRILIAPNGVQPVEKYLHSRYNMYLQVYLHKTVRAAEMMLGKLLIRARDLAAGGGLPRVDPDEPFARLLRDGAAVSMKDYLLTDDDSVHSCMKRWRECDDPVLADLSSRIAERRLFKTLDVSHTPKLASRMREARKTVAAAGLDPRYYIGLDESSNTPYRPYNPREGDSATHIMVEMPGKDAEPRDIHELSEVVRGLARAAFTIRRVVFLDRAGGADLRAEMERIFGL
jgi:hypothetical protein